MEASGRFHILPALPTGKEPAVPTEKQLDGPHSQSGHLQEKKDAGNQANSLVTILIMFSQLTMKTGTSSYSEHAAI
jgi:hypothetical protein